MKTHNSSKKTENQSFLNELEKESGPAVGNFFFEYLNTQQAAKYLQVSTQWLEIGRVKGYGPPFIKLSRLVRYKKSDLDQWMGAHRQLNTVGL